MLLNVIVDEAPVPLALAIESKAPVITGRLDAIVPIIWVMLYRPQHTKHRFLF